METSEHYQAQEVVTNMHAQIDLLLIEIDKYADMDAKGWIR